MRSASAFLWVLAVAGPSTAQQPGAQPQMTPEQAIQLFTEAGFTIADGRPLNRCGGASTPRVAFVDLNGDGAPEAHLADVDPRCYGAPGAYFAILARQADGAWRRLIAEDGIVGFSPARSGGWSDLILEARNSACPGTRRFDGARYAGSGECAVPAPASLAAAAAPAKQAVAPPPAPAAPALAAAPAGTRTEQLARTLAAIPAAVSGRAWDRVRDAFPGAGWSRAESHAPMFDGSTMTQQGTLMLGGARYGVGLSGTPGEVRQVQVYGPPDDLVEWSEIAAALDAQGVEARNIGCHSPVGFGYVRITSGGAAAVMHKFVNYGTAVPSTDYYSFVLDDPFGGQTEQQVAADRSFC